MKWAGNSGRSLSVVDVAVAFFVFIIFDLPLLAGGVVCGTLFFVEETVEQVLDRTKKVSAGRVYGKD